MSLTWNTDVLHFTKKNDKKMEHSVKRAAAQHDKNNDWCQEPIVVLIKQKLHSS